MELALRLLTEYHRQPHCSDLRQRALKIASRKEKLVTDGFTDVKYLQVSTDISSERGTVKKLLRTLSNV